MFAVVAQLYHKPMLFFFFFKEVVIFVSLPFTPLSKETVPRAYQ